MNSKLFWLSPLPCLLSVIILVFTEIPLSSSKPFLCSKPFTCGKITTGYPFWGRDRPFGCGHPNLLLHCEGGQTMIEINDVRYRVINVSDTNQTLKIAREDYLLYRICPPQLANTTLDPTLFELASGYENFTLLYGCPSDVHRVFSCSTNDVNYEDGSVERGSKGPGDCSTSVTVPLTKMLATKIGDLSSVEQALIEGFEVKWKVDMTECRECICSYYDSELHQFICYCRNQPHPGSRTCPQKGSSRRKRNVLVIAISLSVVGTMAALIVVICARRRKLMMFKKNRGPDPMFNDPIEAFIKNYGALTLKRYSYAEVKRMTNSFTDKLGQGGYGAVYKGKLPDGRLVAMKVLSESKGNGEVFINEVASISRTSHVNVVTLVGFCYEKTKRALIYEFMPNGSLDKFSCDQDSSNTKPHLEWKTLYQIAVGIGRGLEYLHRGCNTRILHFDIKPHNILLDENFCPKISDFGLAKLCKRDESIISMLGARGTIGYIAPEVFCRNFGGVSHKSDVYSYGMMVLEMVGGRKNSDGRVSETSEKYFPEWIYKQLEPGEEFKLHGVTTDEEEEIARKMIIVSMCCIQTNPPDRPSMTKVVEMLEGRLQSLQIPPKPFLSSSPRSAQPFSMTSSSANESATLMEKIVRKKVMSS